MRRSARRCSFHMLCGALAIGMASACGKEAPSSSASVNGPAKLLLVSGDAQSANGITLASPLTVRVTDAANRPVSGVAIKWTASDGDAQLSAQTSATDETGQATIKWTLGSSAGRQTVTATASVLPGAQVVFVGNSGGVLSGGVTVQSAPPFSLGSSVASTASAQASASVARNVTGGTASSAHLAQAGRATRRLIVEFEPVAGASQTATGSGAIATNMSMMRRTLASHVASKLVANTELSPAILTARVTVPASESMDSAIAALRRDPGVASVRVDRVVPMLQPYVAAPVLPTSQSSANSAARSSVGSGSPGILPNDPFIPNQLWHYSLVDAPRAWAIQTGSSSVLVAVVDQGVRFDHPAMGSNFTRDGYNFVEGGDRLTDAEPVCGGGMTKLPEVGPGPDPTLPDDLEYDDDNACWYRSTVGDHGLHVSGTIGAVSNDGLGVAGLNWQVSIRPVRVLDITGSGTYFDIAQGVLYAAGLPAAGAGGTVTAPSRASVINMSLGGSSSDGSLARAVTAATAAGSLIVASAGNSQTSVPQYPAAYPEVLAVSALGPDLTIASYTNIGGNVSLAAPGGDARASSSSFVASTTWDFQASAPSYAYYSGTSMAAPHVTGVAALVLAQSPGLTNTQLRARLQSTAVHVGAPGRNDQFGYGIVNAYNAITNTQGPTRTSYVRIVNATTGTTLQTVPVAADGSYSVSRLQPGSYYVYGGQDENGDGLIGIPGRKFGWYGGQSGPVPITIGNGTNATASLTIGTPVESKPHLTTATANRLVLNSYLVGQITSSDGPAFYVFTAPATATYYFEAASVLGACGYGIELDTRLDLLSDAGAVLASNDNVGFPSSSNPLGIPGSPNCSALSRAVTAGTTYYLRVYGGSLKTTGQYHIWVRDQP